MKIYVISLESDHERKATLKSSFPKHFDQFIFVQAVDGAKISSTDYFKLVRPNLYESNRLLSPAEVGCALSHMQVYEKIVQDNEPAIILEDDVIGNDDSLEIALAIAKDTKNNEVIFLGGYDHIKEASKIYLNTTSENIATTQPHEIDKNSYIYLGSTCCYAIGASAANLILDSQKQILKLADSWYKNTLDTNVIFKFTQLLRHPALNYATQNNSNIETQRKSLTYKKSYVLLGESTLLQIKLKRFAIGYYSRMVLNKESLSLLSDIIETGSQTN